MSFIIARLKEASTWAGAAALIGSLGFIPQAAAWADLIPTIGAAVAGILAIVIKEKAS
jgi:hypothetical protein